MIKQNDIIELKIDKLTFKGSALGRYYDNDYPQGFVVFVKNAAPKDILKVRISKLNKNFAIGDIVEIVEPSKHRVKPICPMFNPCGSCFYQYLDYDFLAEEKNNMLKEAFLKLKEQPEFLPIVKSPKISGYRNKIQYKVSQTRDSKRLLIGYYKEKSHEIVNIKYCPIQPKVIDDIIEFIRSNWTLGGYVEKKHSGLLRNIVLRINSDLSSILLTLVINEDEKSYKKQQKEIEEFFNSIMKKFKQLKGVSINFNPDKTNVIFKGESKTIFGESHIIETLSDTNKIQKSFKISPNSFFQVNPRLAGLLFSHIKENIEEDSTILDAYGGVGTIGIFLSEKTKKITLVEENESSIIDAKFNYRLNEVQNYEVFLKDAKLCFKDFIKEKRTFSNVILDPPRKGCDKEVLDIISNLTNSIIYVSCNPQTLIRDIEILQEQGFKAVSTRGFDMFPYSYHIESVTILRKENES